MVAALTPALSRWRVREQLRRTFASMDAVITKSPQTAMMSCVRLFINLRNKRDAMSGVDAVRVQVTFGENLP